MGAVPPTQPPPRKSRRNRWLVVGAIVVVVIGIVAFQNWQTQQTWQQGHEAYLAGDCATAVPKLEQIADGDGDQALQAAAELEECQDVLAAQQLADGDPAGAVLAYSVFITKYPSSPLVATAKPGAQEVIRSREPDKLATADLCDGLPTLEAQGLVETPADTIPPLLLACATTYEADARFADALILLDRFLTDHADHALFTTAEEAFARVSVADAKANNAPEIAPPPKVGESGEGNLVKVVIQNDSPKSMSLVFNGPDVRVERLDPCTECIEYHGLGPDACPELGQVGEYVMEPGTYDVVVKASDDAKVTPFRGTWTLEPGDEYYSCFYLVTE